MHSFDHLKRCTCSEGYRLSGDLSDRTLRVTGRATALQDVVTLRVSVGKSLLWWRREGHSSIPRIIFVFLAFPNILLREGDPSPRKHIIRLAMGKLLVRCSS